MIIDDDNFRQFAGNLERTIDGYGPVSGSDGALLLKQRGQFRDLIAFERDFRETLIRCRAGAQTYRAFISKVCDGNKNILTSRPFFRERQEVCIGPISQALKKRHVQSLYQYHFNYNFVAFVLGTRRWPPQGRLSVLARKIAALRREIVELNMPLAISQARIFWQKAPAKTQDTRFTFMDFVQVAADGLMSAVDKFVLPLGLDENAALIRVWRAVAIGRMKGNFIEMFSETSIHFWPQDKTKLYRANKHLKDFGGVVDFDKLADLVNKDLMDRGLHTTASELSNLMGAAANTGSGVMGSDEDSDTNEAPLDRAAAAAEWQPDVRFERAQTMHVLRRSVSFLDCLERKLVRMKGVSFESI